VGLKLGTVAPQTNPDYHFKEAATAVRGLYVHDDRLGPYASADIMSYTVEPGVLGAEKGKVVTALNIEWPDRPVPYELSIVLAMVVPLPRKVRLTLAQVRRLGLEVAEAVGADVFPEFQREVVLNCRYRTAVDYRAASFGFGLSNAGVQRLVTRLVLSRYLGVIELTVPGGPLVDVLVDSTETEANPSVLAFVRRSALPPGDEPKMAVLADSYGARLIV
jgi:hypothetical protein